MNEKTFTVEDARAMARAAHAGQKDKQGRDYYEHHIVPIAESVVALGEEAVIAALLHDIVEDTNEDSDINWTVELLSEAGVPERSVRAVDSVTRREGEPYPDLITRSCDDELGVHIKLADNGQNISANPGLAAVNFEKAERLLNGRYIPARDRLIVARYEWANGLRSNSAA